MEEDIVGAIAAEKQYIIDSYNNPSLSIYDYLKPYGFDNLDMFDRCKFEYQLADVKFKLHMNESTEGIDKKVWAALLINEAHIWVPKLENTTACIGVDDFDYDLAEELGVDTLDMPHSGGTIITGPEDLTIGLHFYSTEIDVTYNYFFNKMSGFLVQYGITPDGNDFMLDGKKVIGCASYRNDSNVSAFFFSASFSDHLDIIKQLCQKEMVKVPGYIPSTLLTRQRFLDEVLTWVDYAT